MSITIKFLLGMLAEAAGGVPGCGLVHNALELVLEEGNYILSDVFYGQSDVCTARATWKRSDHILLFGCAELACTYNAQSPA